MCKEIEETVMEYVANQYNQCIRLIQQGRMMQAKELMLSLASLLPGNEKISWVLGLLEVYTGYPQKGIVIWKTYCRADITQQETIRTVEKVLPTYEEFYRSYNKAVVFMKKKQYEEAKNILQTILGQQKKYPLPVNVYYAYLLCLLAMGNKENILNEIEQFPRYIKEEKEILMFQRKYGLFETSESVTYKKKNWFVHTAYAFLLIVSLLAGGYFIHNLNQKHDKEVDAKIAAEKKQNQVYKKEEQILKEKNASLEKQMKENQVQLTPETEVLQSSLLKNDSLKYKASWDLYKEGHALYKEGQYENAIKSFNNARTVLKDSDVADDALYFTLLSKVESNDYTGIEALYDEFLNSSSPNFKESSYVDAVLLSKANYLVETGKKEEAMGVLKQLEEKYPNNWTGKKAKALHRTLLGG